MIWMNAGCAQMRMRSMARGASAMNARNTAEGNTAEGNTAEGNTA
jgi:hypothetical protein